MGIEVRHVSKSFGQFVALNDVSLEVGSGELVALLGPSGSGKTTLLRIIAGLEAADAGSVLFDGEDATNRNARHRGVGFVFQHYALFRHMSVFENIAFGLRVQSRSRRLSERDISKRVKQLLDLVQLDFMADRRPSELSGGQRQRVALARALAIEPRVLLLDEPFGALDAKVRQELRKWLRRLHREIQLTSVFVTHDQEEALELADRVAVMNRGAIEQQGTPDDVVEHPASPFVIGFLGTVNTFHGRVESGVGFVGPLTVQYPGFSEARPRPAAAYMRPHELEVSRSETGGGLWTTLSQVLKIGAVARLELASPDGMMIRAELGRDEFERLDFQSGDPVYVKPKKVMVFVNP
jgi:sulfate transport system ATP-binding protein